MSDADILAALRKRESDLQQLKERVRQTLGAALVDEAHRRALDSARIQLGQPVNYAGGIGMLPDGTARYSIAAYQLACSLELEQLLAFNDRRK